VHIGYVEAITLYADYAAQFITYPANWTLFHLLTLLHYHAHVVDKNKSAEFTMRRFYGQFINIMSVLG